MRKINYGVLALGLLLGFSGCTEHMPGMPNTCEEYKKTNNNMYMNVKNRFDEVYFSKNDYIGAHGEANLLSKNMYQTKSYGSVYHAVSREKRKAQSAFNMYKKYTKIARESGCNMTGYKENPLNYVYKKLKLSEK